MKYQFKGIEGFHGGHVGGIKQLIRSAVKRENFCEDLCYDTIVGFSLREKSINFKLNFGNNEVEKDSAVQIPLESGRISFTFIAFVNCYNRLNSNEAQFSLHLRTIAS